MATAHFTYFKGRGHGERVRYALAAAGVEYTEAFLVSPGDMDAIRGRCLLGQCPLLEVDGLQLVQSWAIVRYLAAKNGLTPPTPALAFKADALAEQVRDFTEAGGFVSYGWAQGFHESEEARAPGAARMATACSRYLPTFERAIGDGACLTGEAPCWAGALGGGREGPLPAAPRLYAHSRTPHPSFAERARRLSAPVPAKLLCGGAGRGRAGAARQAGSAARAPECRPTHGGALCAPRAGAGDARVHCAGPGGAAPPAQVRGQRTAGRGGAGASLFAHLPI
jgi:glutathione S-transferase